MQISKTYIIIIFLIAKILATTFSLYIVDQFSPLVDAKLYQNELYFERTIAFRTYFIQSIASITNFFTSPIISHYIFSILSISGILWYVISSNVRWYILLILLLPSSMIWTSVIGKEAIYYLCFSILLINWNKYINQEFKLENYLLVIIASVVCMMLRPHYTICIIWLFYAAIIIGKTNYFKEILIISYLLILSFLLIILFLGNELDSILKINFFDIRWRAFASIDIKGNASRHIDLGLLDVANKNLCKGNTLCDWILIGNKKFLLESQFTQYFGTGFIFGIVGPFPNEVLERPEFAPFFLEGVMILFSPLVFLIIIKSFQKFNDRNVYFLNYVYGVLPAIFLVMLIHAFFGILNPGTAIRWRVNFELIFYFAPLLIFFNIHEFKNDKDNTLSP